MAYAWISCLLVFLVITACWISIKSPMTSDELLTWFYCSCASIMSRTAGEHCPRTKAYAFSSFRFRLAPSFLYRANSNFQPYFCLDCRVVLVTLTAVGQVSRALFWISRLLAPYVLCDLLCCFLESFALLIETSRHIVYVPPQRHALALLSLGTLPVTLWVSVCSSSASWGIAVGLV